MKTIILSYFRNDMSHNFDWECSIKMFNLSFTQY